MLLFRPRASASVVDAYTILKSDKNTLVTAHKTKLQNFEKLKIDSITFPDVSFASCDEKLS